MRSRSLLGVVAAVLFLGGLVAGMGGAIVFGPNTTSYDTPRSVYLPRDPSLEATVDSLDRAGVLDAAPAVLRECVAAAGDELAADPVAAPPYVVVTGEGVLLRATLDRRLLVHVRAFRLRPYSEPGTPPRYERGGDSPAAAVAVETTD